MHAKAASEKPDDSGFVFGRRWSEESTRKEKTLWAEKTKKPPLHIALGYSGISDSEVAAEALAAHDGIKAHPELFPNPPDLNAFLATIQAFEGSIAAAKDGGKKAISQKKKDRAATIKALRQLGHYVEANCKDDVTIVNASGFKVAAAGKVPAQPMPKGVIEKVAAGSLSGQIVVKGKPISRFLNSVTDQSR